MNFAQAVNNLIKSPLYLAQLGTGAKSFQANPFIGSPLLNQWKLHDTRLKLAATMAQRRRQQLSQVISTDDQQAFARDGYVVKENFLPPEEFDKLRSEVFDTNWAIREMRQGGAITRRVPFDFFLLQKNQPMLAKFVRDPAAANLIRYVASTGGLPIFWLQAIFAGHDQNAHDPQTDIHADTFHSTAKAWLFVHDVGPNDGPLSYVPGSHLLTRERLAWEHEQSLVAAKHPVVYHARGSFRASPEDLRCMNLLEPRRFTVTANTLVVADTFGFHARTASLRPSSRVEIYASLRRNPFRPWNGLDVFSLPYLRDRSGATHLKALDALKWAGLKMPWKPMGLQRIDTPPKF